jgi:hypothetical protein
MIWFACKQCGKHHGRAESLIGTLVFCECGHGNRVPWSSTVPEPELPKEPAPRPAPRAAPSPENGDRGPPPPAGDFPRPQRRPRPFRRPDPNFCLNHDETASEHTCDACRARFCSACVVTLQGKTLCGPCKNFRVRGLHRPARASALAIVALVLGLVGGALSFVLGVVGASTSATGSVALGLAFCLVGLLLPGAGLVLSRFALRDVETKANVRGRSLALTGVMTSLVGVAWCASVFVLVLFKQWAG